MKLKTKRLHIRPVRIEDKASMFRYRSDPETNQHLTLIPDTVEDIERLGFRKEAHFIESLFFHGQWVDDLVFAMLAREWKERSL